MSQRPVTATWDGTHLNFWSDGALLFQADGAVRELLTVGLTGQETLTVTPAQLNVLVARVNSLRSYLADAMLTIGTLAISATAEKFQTTTTALYTIAGITYSLAATDNLVFSAANTINAAAAATAFWGAWIVEVGVDGLVHTKPAAFTSAADMSYTTEALAIAALPSPTASHVQLGYITAQNVVSAKWDANTDNLTVGAGATNVTARSFYDLPAAKTLPAAIA